MKYASEQIWEQANANNNKSVFGPILTNVKAFGAKGDGIADDTLAFSKAISSLELTGGTVFAPSGVYLISANLLINKPNIKIVGNGCHYNHDFGSVVGGTTLKWIGAVGGTMITVTAINGPGNQLLTNPAISNLALDCNGLAAHGLSVLSVRMGVFNNLVFYTPRTAGIYIGVVAELGEARDTQFCRFENINMRLLEYDTGKGIQIAGGTLANTSFNVFSQIDIQHKNGTAIEMGGSDNNYFTNIRCNRAGGGTAYGIELLSSSVENGLAATAIYLSQISAGNGGMILRAGTYPSSATIWAYGRGNGEPAPVVESGAILYCNDEYNYNIGFAFDRIVIAEDETAARAERDIIGTNNVIFRNNSGGGAIFSDGTNRYLVRINGGNLEILRTGGSGHLVLPSETTLDGCRIGNRFVEIGPNDSGGTGYKVLRIQN